MNAAANESAEAHTTLLALLPSIGLGGGIERYCDWMLDAVEKSGAMVDRVALLHPGETPSLSRKVRFVLRCARAARRARSKGPVSVVICHPNLAIGCLPAVRLAGLRSASCRVLFYGDEIWSQSRISASLLRFSRVRLLTVSTFSAGALTSIGVSHILTPGIRTEWYEKLTQAGSSRPPRTDRDSTLRILTVFRLDAACSKGLPELLEALKHLRDRIDCRLTVAGSNALPEDLRTEIEALPWVGVMASPGDDELARLYAEADVFVLATRTRVVPPASGEGFGIVLVEAQLTGTPVIAPAFGGSNDAFIEGITGLKPVDESVEALESALALLAENPMFRAKIAHNARVWSGAMFEPSRASGAVAPVLVGIRGEAFSRTVGPGLDFRYNPTGPERLGKMP